VTLNIRKVKKGISMEVSDNGKSFQAGGRNQSRHSGGKRRLGLLGMEERVRLVDGEFALEARPSVGTTIRVVVPLRPTARPESPRPKRAAILKDRRAAPEPPELIQE
jgi:signal transduction histidine kinase